jgi:hypothetical protein
MADVELVIKIPEEDYNGICHFKNVQLQMLPEEVSETLIRIANGIQLPKGHGDLIDRDDLLADSYCIDDWSGNEVNIVDVMTVIMADAIIEADKKSEG